MSSPQRTASSDYADKNSDTLNLKTAKWVPDWSLTVKALPPGCTSRNCVFKSKPKGVPPCGGKWVRAKVPQILR